jgi:hypothetical protein
MQTAASLFLTRAKKISIFNYCRADAWRRRDEKSGSSWRRRTLKRVQRNYSQYIKKERVQPGRRTHHPLGLVIIFPNSNKKTAPGSSSLILCAAKDDKK